MAKIGTVTFHASHNYGAVLQAYALQQFLLSLGYDDKIINLKTETLKETSRVLTKRKGLKFLLKNLYTLIFIYKDRTAKYNKFLEFIDQNLIMTAEVGDDNDFVKEAEKFDCVIAGSDQIWNVGVYGLNDRYFLKGVPCRKVAYAVSTGKNMTADMFSEEQKALINQFDKISVRDSATAEMIKTVSGREVPVVLDPTLLFGKDFYENKFSDSLKERIIKDRYIYLYTLDNNKDLIDVAKRLSKKTGLKIYISHISGTHYCFGLNKALASGPKEFLNHIKFADYVITSSYHGTLFSIIFGKQFWSYNALKDNRRKEVLSFLSLTDRDITIDGCDAKFDETIAEDRYVKVRDTIEKLKEKSKEYLVEALGE